MNSKLEKTHQHGNNSSRNRSLRHDAAIPKTRDRRGDVPALGPVARNIEAVIPKGRGVWEIHLTSEEVATGLEIAGLRMVQNKLSFIEVRKLVEMATPTEVDKSYAAAASAPKRATKSVAVNTELTWPVDDSKYKKLSDIEKVEKQNQRAAKKQKEITAEGSQKVSLDFKKPPKQVEHQSP